ncbi:3-hydroxybutyryl-CoA dehydrogenase [Phytopseudomonas dryadis]|uniref:L-gulonate 3-dehydrogenase n=1 Tax=Phytopseudomonas dryadis TaxID=2487520 RepID=A0A4Q9QZM8_9GAMM|nr:3-hydroxybutyryl-CoA dehydrogenase [Pseudomonas dryadis]TBU90263.1 3-hydroxybutyryl-CoA dehydrogenase [Pseudomonas dryadis]
MKTVHILGAGRMGQGMALAFIQGGLPVVLIDVKQRGPQASAAYADQVREAIARELRAKVALGRLTQAQVDIALARLSVLPRQGCETALAEARYLFEGVPEVLEMKRELFAWLGACIPADARVASTTSTFLVSELATCISGPQRFINAHWLNPADLMPLVEVSRSDSTDPAVVSDMLELLRSIGKVPVVCSASPGYIVPRIQAQAMNEAARMVEEGVASAEDIDKAIRVGFGLRFAVLGLLEFIDWGGGDILFYASKYLSGQLGERFDCADIVRENMARGRNGLRDGQGFYDYAGRDTDAYKAQRMQDFFRLLDATGLTARFDQALENQG